VPLRSLDRHRLHIVLTSYIVEQCIGSGSGSGSGHNNDNVKDDKNDYESMELEGKGCGTKAIAVLTPSQVAEKESFLPMVSPDDSVHWLTIGASLMDICPSGAAELEGLLLLRQKNNKSTHDDDSVQQQFTNINETTNPGHFVDSPQHYERYILKVHIPSLSSSSSSKSDDYGIMLQLTFLEGATDDDILRGMFHAYTAYHYYTLFTKDSSSSSRSTIINNSNNNGGNNDYSNITGNQMLKETHGIMLSRMPIFIENLREVGWQLGGTGFVNVECGSSHRLTIQNV